MKFHPCKSRYFFIKRVGGAMNINTNWYVITGGPSSSKTKIIEYLAFLGYPVIPEVARVLIDIEKSKGKTTGEIRSNEAEFQKRVLQMKIRVENIMPAEQTTFFERGIPDSIAYYEICGENQSPVIEASRKRKYKGVFLLEQLPFEKDYARIENEQLAQNLNRLLYEAYSSLEYNIIHVPLKPIEERAQFILNKIGER